MSYKEAFPDFPAADIPAVFLSHPWTDGSWSNDTCPSFWRPFDHGREVHVYVDYTDSAKREASLPKYTVRFTDDDGQFIDDEPLDFSADSLAHVLDRIGFIVGEVST